MELSLKSDIYEPSIGDDGNYYDCLPSSSAFKNGIRCPCGSRKEHVYDSRSAFNIHTKSKTHQKWVSDLNANKMNYYTEYEKFKELVNSQRIIIAKMEKEINIKMKQIDYLTQKLMEKDIEHNNVGDLISFD